METQTPQIDYDKSLDVLLSDMDKPVLPYVEPDKIGEPATIGEPEIINDTDFSFEGGSDKSHYSEPSQEPDNIVNDIPALADLLVWGIDMLGGAGLNYLAKSSDKQAYRLEHEEKKQFIKAWKQYLKNTPDFKMSPSTILLTTVLIIYTPKVIQAIAQRREVLQAEFKKEVADGPDN